MPLNVTRRNNLLVLFTEFVAAAQKADPAASLTGLDKAFSAQLQIANTAVSSMKTGKRQIGPKLARQIEAACKRPSLWLDTEHSDVPMSRDERELDKFLKLAARAFRRADAPGRAALKAALLAQMKT